MNKEASGRKAWKKPKIGALGTIRDVAGSQTPLTQATNTKS
jgi:hypothetical protein